MAQVDWNIKGLMMSGCSCDYGCPCQFNALPTRGYCHATVGMRIANGYFGNTKIDGVAWAAVFKWPKAIHEGNGEALAVIDDGATPEQRDAVLKIITGQETDPGATVFNVFAGTLTKFHEPRFAKVDFDADYKNATGRLHVAGVTDMTFGPIRNPVTGEAHRARVTLPHGFEYHEAEYGSSDVKTDGPMVFDWTGRHGHLAMMDIGPKGPRH
jgi:hypothetical protein